MTVQFVGGPRDGEIVAWQGRPAPKIVVGEKLPYDFPWEAHIYRLFTAPRTEIAYYGYEGMTRGGL
jgi:hypothetical protein